MSPTIEQRILDLGYGERKAKKGIHGFIDGWRAAVRHISEEKPDWPIDDYWYALQQRSVLDELLDLLHGPEREQVAATIDMLDQEFRQNTTAVPHDLCAGSQTPSHGKWREYRLPHKWKLPNELAAMVRAALA